MVGLILRFFGYAIVPQELAHLACQARMIWEKDSADPDIGKALLVIELWARSTSEPKEKK